jgi:tetratricopeptide (TPR) repeat protein/ferredoxin
MLAWAPAVLAFYMFLWPTLARLGRTLLARLDWFDATVPPPFPGFTSHLTTDAFWATFPGPVFAVATLATCGFAAVYFLGAKGFCTYGCPYGALFGGLDRLSPGKIVVDDSCEQCGHCTATCTSNVLVHEEVRLFGEVTDPGCMKCMDCVSVCPKNALRFSFSTPSLFKRAAAGSRRSRRYTLTTGEEIALAMICVGSTLAFRGLYDGPPLLMSIGLGGITAFVALQLWRLRSAATVRIQSLVLKAGGVVSPAGRAFAAVTLIWLAFTTHSAVVQWERARGRVALERTESTRDEALSGAFAARNYSPAHERAVESAHAHFTRADRWGLVDVLEIKLGLAWAQLLRDESAEAERSLEEALALFPSEAELHQHRIDFLAARGRAGEALEALEEKIRVADDVTAADHFVLGGSLVGAGRSVEAIESFTRAVELTPDSAEARFNLGGLLRRSGRNAEAVEQFELAAALDARDPGTRVELGLAYAAVGRGEDAVREFRTAIELDPQSPESRLHLPELIRQVEAGVPGR